MKELGINEWIGIVVVLVVVFFLFGTQFFPMIINDGSHDATAEEQATSINDTDTSISGLEITDTTIGTGEVAESGDVVTVHYTGTFEDGEKFDSSLDRGTPFSFNLGAGQVIQGWEKGVVGMKVGGERKLVIAPELAYGPVGGGHPLSGMTLHFTVTLLSVTKPN